MAILSTSAWAAHNLALATSIGGTLYGQAAMHPALRSVSDAQERDRVAEAAWRRFNWMNLAAHGAMAATWFAGRKMLTGAEVSSRARSMTRAKDVLVVASLLTGLGTVLVGRTLGRRVREGDGPAREASSEGGGAFEERSESGSRRLERAVSLLGTLNLMANAGVAGVTTMLSMESAQSIRFAPVSRELP